MHEDEATRIAERFIMFQLDQSPEISHWKSVFQGMIFQTQVLSDELQRLAKENYQLRMMLWQLHECKNQEQLNGAPHEGIYMKCVEKKIDFANDPYWKLWEAFRKPMMPNIFEPLKITVTSAGENATHTAEERS